jgi:predicted RNase H-like HicB family nuclease
MKDIIVTVGRTPNNYCAYIEILPGCVTTHKTFEGLVRNMYEAVEFHLEGSREDDDYIHPDFDGEYNLVFKFAEYVTRSMSQNPISKPKKRELVTS